VPGTWPWCRICCNLCCREYSLVWQNRNMTRTGKVGLLVYTLCQVQHSQAVMHKHVLVFLLRSVVCTCNMTDVLQREIPALLLCADTVADSIFCCCWKVHGRRKVTA
jgi:hypothetical protein